MDNTNNSKIGFSKETKDLVSADIGQKIRHYRQLVGMTQKQLAETCNKSEPTIRNYELGNRFPDTDTISNIATALSISPYVLVEPKPYYPTYALQFLFGMEKTLELTPIRKDGKVYLEVSSDMDVDDTTTVAPMANLKRMISMWCDMYEKYQEGKIDEDTYLKWQSTVNAYGTAVSEEIYNEAMNDL